MTIPPAGHQSALILLDAVSVYRSEDEDASVMNLALTRLDEVGAVTATMNDEDELTVHADNLVGGSLVTMQYLLGRLAALEGKSLEAVIIETREALDSF